MSTRRGLRMLSILLTMIWLKRRTNIPDQMLSDSINTTLTGTATNADPTIGMMPSSDARQVKKSGYGTPATQSERPVTTHCTSAMTKVDVTMELDMSVSLSMYVSTIWSSTGMMSLISSAIVFFLVRSAETINI